eukprot:766617-Hanusia_phi.AAC.2
MDLSSLHRLLEHLPRRLPVRLLPHRQLHHLHPQRLEDVAVAGISGRCHCHAVAMVEGASEGDNECAATSGRDEHASYIDLHPVAALVVPCYPLPQLQQAYCLRVAKLFLPLQGSAGSISHLLSVKSLLPPTSPSCRSTSPPPPTTRPPHLPSSPPRVSSLTIFGAGEDGCPTSRWRVSFGSFFIASRITSITRNARVRPRSDIPASR